MEIMSEIQGLTQNIYSSQEDIHLFRYYRYLNRISDNSTDLLKVDDHFAPNLSAKFHQLSLISNAKPVHMP